MEEILQIGVMRDFPWREEIFSYAGFAPTHLLPVLLRFLDSEQIRWMSVLEWLTSGLLEFLGYFFIF